MQACESYGCLSGKTINLGSIEFSLVYSLSCACRDRHEALCCSFRHPYCVNTIHFNLHPEATGGSHLICFLRKTSNSQTSIGEGSGQYNGEGGVKYTGRSMAGMHSITYDQGLRPYFCLACGSIYSQPRGVSLTKKAALYCQGRCTRCFGGVRRKLNRDSTGKSNIGTGTLGRERW
jgi:hypothetical protein